MAARICDLASLIDNCRFSLGCTNWDTLGSFIIILFFSTSFFGINLIVILLSIFFGLENIFLFEISHFTIVFVSTSCGLTSLTFTLLLIYCPL